MKIKVKPASENVLDERGRVYPMKTIEIEKSVYVARLIREGSLVVQPAKSTSAGKEGN